MKSFLERFLFLFCLLLVVNNIVYGFTVAPSFAIISSNHKRKVHISSVLQRYDSSSSTFMFLSTERHDENNQKHGSNNDAATLKTATSSVKGSSMAVTALGVLTTMLTTTGLPAHAASVINTDPVSNALVAYSHYFFILVAMAILVYERITVSANMDKETEKSLVLADAAYGVTALLLFVTGYFRATEFGKGWDFYSHEPLFWLKISAAGLVGGLSAFPTITLVKRGAPLLQGGDVQPMSEKLAKRMKSVINAEISAVLTIPLLATLMARGVGYNDNFPWPVGAALVTIVFIGSGFFYGKQAITWKEDD